MFHFLAILLIAGLLSPAAASGQDLTPRTYWPAPKGTEIIVLGYAYQTGDVVTDPSLPIVGVDSQINSGVLAWQKTLGLFGRTSNLQIELPYADGTTRGEVEGFASRRDVQGFGDLAATLSINLVGAPSLGPEDFLSFRENPRRIIATSIKIVAPTGQYDKERLINIGTNRWATRLRVGMVEPLAPRWLLEMSVSSWFFETNDEFFGTTRKQRPIGAFDVSLIRRFRPGFWASLDGTYYVGGRTTVDGALNADLQRNARAGFSLVYPVAPRHAIKLAYSNGISTESGGDYQSISLSYVYRVR
jgi:hypothetical protein